MDIVVVEWLDAVRRPELGSIDELLHVGVIQTTVGFLLKKDKTGISVAVEQCGDGGFRDVIFIPKGMIRKVTKQ